MTIQLDGSLVDWTAADRLEKAATTVSGYEVYGRYEAGTFYLALQSTVAIGANTTLWLNTDNNTATGFQVFGTSAGAEFNVNFSTDTFARLFSGDAGQTFVSDGISYAFSADHKTLELALPKALLGANVTSVGMVADINDSVFLPGSFASGAYTVTDPASLQFDGILNEWTPDQRLDVPATAVANYEIYGKYAANEFVFALKSAVAIGVGTTFWFDTDKNATTGFQAFGGTNETGAEFNLNFGADGIAHLYSGAAGQTFVGDIQYTIGPDGKTIEFALPKTLIGAGVTTVSMKADVNDLVFLPGSYAAGKYTVTDPASLPPPVTPADGYRIAIVYSETSADLYFNKMAYAQLFMTAQSQAMAAGIPFDIISESDLTLANLNNLQGYDAIVFPSFTNVSLAHYSEIQQVLENLVFQHNVPLIAAGDFMTNDETGAVLPGNPYERMQELLGVDRTGGGGDVTVQVVAGNSEIVSGYGAGGTIHTYDHAWTSYFSATNPATSTVIATQVVGGVTHNGVVGTVTGGHNVHFATEALLADSNLLGKALDYVTAPDTGVQLSLHMTREASMVASRTDVDQAQELSDVTGGMLTNMVSILAGLKAQYNFVGSYYIDLGFYPNDGQTTNWALSAPLYQQLLAMGNEIGSHSYTHPEDTNRLLPNVLTQSILDQVRAAYGNTGDFTPYALRGGDANPAIVNQLRAMGLAEINTKLAEALAAPDPNALDTIHKALLEATFQFQFQASKAAIEAALGITITGAAVPGMPESLDTAHAILPYYDYISGGASLVGAGYPGAFGYLTPGDTSKVYIAPNMSFDFTLLGWQNLTAPEAQAAWLAEFAALTKNSDQPIVVWPWHDYGITSWPLDGIPSGYTLQMFTAFIAAAAQSGAEFVTLADLAARIAAFGKTSFSYSVSGDTVTATATPASGNLGTFALDFDSLGGKYIQSVAGWYAYDHNSVFLDADGGTFTVKLGTTIDDVTHITSIADRAKLMTLTGDGTNLTFTIFGEGKVVIDLKMLPGMAYMVTGATVVSLVGEIMTLDLGAIGTHAVTVTHAANVAPSGTDNTITILEDTPRTFATADFGFTDSDGNTLSAVKITTLPTAGTLTLGGVAVTLGQSILAADIGQLVWTPPLNANGNAVGSFTFQVVDNGGTANGGQDTDQSPNTITFNVTPVNDAPSGTDNTITILEDTPRTFAAADFGFTDIDGNTLSAVKITTLPTAGLLTLGGVAVTVGQSILAADIGQLVWTPPLNANGNAVGSFTFQVVDNGGTANGGQDTDQSPNTITFNVTPVNDAPSGADKTIVVAQNGAYTFAAADFGFSDVDNDTLLAVKITTLPSTGVLRLNGAVVTAGQLVAAASLTQLVWTPPLNGSGNALGSLAFQVMDNGGTANGGVDLDPTPNTITFNVSAGNQPPIGPSTPPTVSLQAGLTNAPLNLAALTDPEGDILSYKVTALPSQGLLFLSTGAAVSLGATLTQAQFLGLAYKSPETAGNRGLTFDVSDGTNHTILNVVLHVTPATNDTLTGTAGNDRLDGGAGNDILNGLAGADTMIGGTGNDIFIVDNIGDVVIELVGGGSDRVITSVSYTLTAGSEIELFTTNNLAAKTAINLTGNAFAQTIQGNAGANIINGGGGADIMQGFGGNDMYFVDNAGDKVYEAVGGGSDRVLTSVSYTLTAGSEIELFTTTDTKGTKAINLTGNAFGQVIQGNAGVNVLNGGAGNDTLTGFGGADVFVFNTPLNATTNRDTITDFAHGIDHIHLENAIFTKLAANGVLNAAFFRPGGVALDPNDYIVYNQKTGALYYDADGSGSGSAIQFATLTNKPALTYQDFVVI